MPLPTELYIPEKLSDTLTVTRVDGGYIFETRGKEAQFVSNSQIEGLASFFLSDSEFLPVKEINNNLDAFARLRVSNPETIFDSKQIFDKQDLFWSDEITGAGGITYNTNQASTTLTVATASAEMTSRQSYQYFNYQPGKSQLILMTGIIGSASPNFTQRIGQFNSDNGLFFEVTSAGIGVVRRTFTSGSAVDTRINQADWNIDKLDGTGKSGYTLDLTKTQIFFFDYEWLGVGTVRFGLFIDGKPIYCHYIHNANVLTEVYMSSPNLPLRYEVSNDGSGVGTKDVVHICSSVITEGGRSETGVLRGLNRADNTLTTNNNLLIYPLIGLRFQSGKLGALIKLLELQILCTTTSEYAWYIILSPTITGTAPTWTAITNSTLEYSFPTNATTISGGTVIFTGIGSDSNQVKIGSGATVDNDLVLGSANDGTPQEIYIGVQRLTGTSETFYASLNFSETI